MTYQFRTSTRLAVVVFLSAVALAGLGCWQFVREFLL